MDNALEVLRRLAAEWDYEHRSSLLKKFRTEISTACTRFLKEETAPLSDCWKKSVRGRQTISRNLALTLQNIQNDPRVFGLDQIIVENDDWLKNFLNRIWKTSLLQPFISVNDIDRKAEIFLLNWLICVERRDAFLQRSVRCATGLDETKHLDAFDYIAATILLLFRNTPLNWHQAVLEYRQELKKCSSEEGLPPPSQWMTETIKQFTEDKIKKAFHSLKAREREQNSFLGLSDLLDKDFTNTDFLRQFAGLSIAYRNDYVYMMKRYFKRLGKAIVKKEINLEYVTHSELAELLRKWATTDPKNKAIESFDVLFLAPQQVTKKRAVPTTKKTSAKEATPKVPFRALRYALFLLIGISKDQFYGQAADMRTFLFRLGFACGLSSDGLQKLLLEQNLAGIDFKTAPELILAYGADRAHRENSPIVGPPNKHFSPNTYAETVLMQHVYQLLVESTDLYTETPKLLLESTYYFHIQYDKISGKNGQPDFVSPCDFLKWLHSKTLPPYTIEKILANKPLIEKKLTFCCMQLFYTLKTLSHLNVKGADRLESLSSWSSEKENQVKEQSMYEKSIQNQELAEKLLLQINSGLSVFNSPKISSELQCLLNTFSPPHIEQEDKKRAYFSPLQFFFPDEDVQKLVIACFPYDKAEWWTLMDSEEMATNATRPEDLRKIKLQQVCRCVASRQLLQRDDFLCLLFADYLLSHDLKPEIGETLAETYVRFFEQEQEMVKESRMLPFCAKQEPHMAEAFQDAVKEYQNYLRNI